MVFVPRPHDPTSPVTEVRFFAHVHNAKELGAKWREYLGWMPPWDQSQLTARYSYEKSPSYLNDARAAPLACCGMVSRYLHISMESERQVE